MAPYPAAISLAVASPIVILLTFPPLCWHIKAKNVGTSSVILWTIMLNFTTFINAILWPDDDFSSHFDGSGLCDVEAKLQIAAQVALPASFACILRALASVLDTDNLTVTNLRKRRNMIIDLSWCVGFPLLQMPLHYIVQPTRYILFGISGCSSAVSNDWVMVTFILLPPVIWTIICAYYAVFVIVRLWRYRNSIKSILQHSGTDKSRFLRLYAICIIWIFGSVPVSCYMFWYTFLTPMVPFRWPDVHDPTEWSVIYKIPSFGMVLRDRYIWLTTAIMLFLFFGIGKEALRMYSDVLARLTSIWRPRSSGLQADATSSARSKDKMVRSSGSALTESTLGSSIDLEAMQHPVERV